MSLDERLEGVNRGMRSVNDAMQPFLTQVPTPKPNAEDSDDDDDISTLSRKHATLVSEWESVQDESEVLREELKEDKWLTVFRTVSEQADGMMSSLEKAVQRCQVCRSFMSQEVLSLKLSVGLHLARSSPSCCCRGVSAVFVFGITVKLGA